MLWDTWFQVSNSQTEGDSVVKGTIVENGYDSYNGIIRASFDEH